MAVSLHVTGARGFDVRLFTGFGQEPPTGTANRPPHGRFLGPLTIMSGIGPEIRQLARG